MEGENFYAWNDTAIASVFMRLITKKNYPYSDEYLSYDEYNRCYKQLGEYIKFRRNNNPFVPSPLYKWSDNAVGEIYSLLDYDVDNQSQLIELWKRKIILGLPC